MAFRPLCGEPLCKMLSMQATPEEVQLRVGVRADHLAALAKEASHQDSAIGIRFVEPSASKLIACGYQTKNFSVKGKTSNWGPMKGHVPVDQALSKLAMLHRDRIAQANANVQNMLLQDQPQLYRQFSGVPSGDGTRMQIIAAPLLLSTRVFMGQYPHLSITAETSTIDFCDAAMPDVAFCARRRGEQWAFTYAEGDARHAPLQVVAYQDRDASRALRGAPLLITADYDLLLLMPSIRSHGSKDNRPVPLVTAANYSAYCGRSVVDKTNAAQKDRDLLMFHKPIVGNASQRIEDLIKRLSAAFPIPSIALQHGATTQVTEGAPLPARPLIHHSDDLGNPFADAAANYPALIVLPKPLAHYVRNAARGVVVENDHFRDRPSAEQLQTKPLATDIASHRSLDAAPYFVINDHVQFCAFYDVLRDVFHFVGAPNPLWLMR